MRLQGRLSLAQLFAISVTSLMVLIVVLYQFVESNAEVEIRANAHELHENTTRDLNRHVSLFRDRAGMPIGLFEEKLAKNLIDPSSEASVEATLYSMMLADPDVVEVSFTQADEMSFATRASSDRILR